MKCDPHAPGACPVQALVRRRIAIIILSHLQARSKLTNEEFEAMVKDRMKSDDPTDC